MNCIIWKLNGVRECRFSISRYISSVYMCVVVVFEGLGCGRVEVENRLLSRVSLLQKCRAVLVLNLYVYSRLEEREKRIYRITGRQIVSGNFVEVDIGFESLVG